MNENMKKAIEMLKNDNTLKKKLVEETRRLAESMKGKGANEILAQAMKNVLGIDLTAADLDAAKAERRELAPDALKDVAGGLDFDELSVDFEISWKATVSLIKDFFDNLF